ncbi:hypothetical protein [Eubacterium limosum]|uniref:hypothetical protein n=1 Tax=Eubacterium limosum TaxID=1736 RepID=UPI0022DED49D|nr:hypothetical protein [Eubacterium limosum]
MLETPERNGHFDIYLLDIPMPELDRLSVGRLLMRTKEGKQTISFYQITYVESHKHHFFAV